MRNNLSVAFLALVVAAAACGQANEEEDVAPDTATMAPAPMPMDTGMMRMDTGMMHMDSAVHDSMMKRQSTTGM